MYHSWNTQSAKSFDTQHCNHCLELKLTVPLVLMLPMSNKMMFSCILLQQLLLWFYQLHKSSTAHLEIIEQPELEQLKCNGAAWNEPATRRMNESSRRVQPQTCWDGRATSGAAWKFLTTIPIGQMFTTKRHVFRIGQTNRANLCLTFWAHSCRGIPYRTDDMWSWRSEGCEILKVWWSGIMLNQWQRRIMWHYLFLPSSGSRLCL